MLSRLSFPRARSDWRPRVPAVMLDSWKFPQTEEISRVPGFKSPSDTSDHALTCEYVMGTNVVGVRSVWFRRSGPLGFKSDSDRETVTPPETLRRRPRKRADLNAAVSGGLCLGGRIYAHCIDGQAVAATKAFSTPSAPRPPARFPVTRENTTANGQHNRSCLAEHGPGGRLPACTVFRHQAARRQGRTQWGSIRAAASSWRLRTPSLSKTARRCSWTVYWLIASWPTICLVE